MPTDAFADLDASRRDLGPPITDSDTTSNSPDPEDPCVDDGKQPQTTVSDDGSESGYDSDLQGVVERVDRSAEDLAKEEQIWSQLNFTPAKPHDRPKILQSELDAFSSDLSAWVHGRATKRRKVSGE